MYIHLHKKMIKTNSSKIALNLRRQIRPQHTVLTFCFHKYLYTNTRWMATHDKTLKSGHNISTCNNTVYWAGCVAARTVIDKKAWLKGSNLAFFSWRVVLRVSVPDQTEGCKILNKRKNHWTSKVTRLYRKNSLQWVF